MYIVLLIVGFPVGIFILGLILAWYYTPKRHRSDNAVRDLIEDLEKEKNNYIL